MRIAFLGDISLNGIYPELYKKGVNPFYEIQPLLTRSDYVIGNLECIAKGDKGENLIKRPRLSTNVETLNYLKTITLNVACLAQNHIYDHLEDGFTKTISFLKENNIKYLGASTEELEYCNPIILEQEGIKIGILNYVSKDTNPNLPEDSRLYLNIFQLESVIKDIQILKPKVNHVVLSLHWGGRVEGGLFPDWQQPKLAHKLIDAGVDLIIGHHSHTVQPYEEYKGKYIFYSLGNFCFSDFTFEEKHISIPRRGNITFIPIFNFTKEGFKFETNYYFNKKNSFELFQKYGIRHKCRNITFKYLLFFYPFWRCYFFIFKRVVPIILFFQRKDLSFKQKVKNALIAIRMRFNVIKKRR